MTGLRNIILTEGLHQDGMSRQDWLAWEKHGEPRNPSRPLSVVDHRFPLQNYVTLCRLKMSIRPAVNVFRFHPRRESRAADGFGSGKGIHLFARGLFGHQETSDTWTSGISTGITWQLDWQESSGQDTWSLSRWKYFAQNTAGKTATHKIVNCFIVSRRDDRMARWFSPRGNVLIWFICLMLTLSLKNNFCVNWCIVMFNKIIMWRYGMRSGLF